MTVRVWKSSRSSTEPGSKTPESPMLRLRSAANNYGVTPRAEGLRYMIREVGADYCVLWDDDCYFHKNALQQIVNSLEEAGRPDLLLVPMRYRRKLVPNPGASPDQLDWGDLDTGSIILRPKLGLEGYEELLKKDFELFLRQRAVSGFPLVPVYSRRKARRPDPRGVVSTDRRARRTQDPGLHPEPLRHTATGHREQNLAPGCLESSRFRLTVNTPVIAVVIISGTRPFYQFSFVPSEDRCGCCQWVRQAVRQSGSICVCSRQGDCPKCAG